MRIVLWGLGIAAAGVIAVVCVIAVALAVAYPNLPDISELSDYRPKLPLRVFSYHASLTATRCHMASDATLSGPVLAAVA